MPQPRYLFDRVMGMDWSTDPTSPGFWTYEGLTINPEVWPWDVRLFALDYTAWVRGLAFANGTKVWVLVDSLGSCG